MKQILDTIQDTAVRLFNVEVTPELTRPNEQFGDYATNVALQLAGRLNKNPREIADALATELQTRLIEIVSNVTVAGPGFINIRLTDRAMLASATMPAAPGVYASKEMVIETNNPNPFKDMHIGHAYNSIVADTVANLLEAGQGNVHRVSYHGDVGLHVGKSMWAILKHIDYTPEQLGAIPENERAKFLSDMYAQGAVAYEQDDLAKQQIEAYSKQSFVLDDPIFEQVYTTCKEWSFSYFDEIFGLIGSKPIERRYLERETDQAGRATVEANLGKVFEQSEGAIIFPGEKYDLHTRVFINSRGNTLYEARDLGLMQLKDADYHPDASYIVTAEEQKEYFRVVFKAAELALPELGNKTHNISTGTVKLSTGKMSSRTGQVVNIGWLFEEIGRALKERGAEDELIHDSIIGALRYTMLRVRIGSDVIFDVSDAISLEGNSGPYLQYAHARAKSILRKSTAESAEPIELTPDERSLVRKISEYVDVTERAVSELMPHHIATYLYELSQEFNRFYEHNRVIGDAREKERLWLVSLYTQTLAQGLGVLGIPAPEKM